MLLYREMILLGFEGLDNLAEFKKEFGPKFKHFMFGMRAHSLSEADEIIRIAAD
ncbi:MAG: hypothetical protein NTX50_22890 [Candidatus Sumerlaeota bacterium]|nr:hypothetical protein [Candidatus Sumerlaeota bacterium]